MHEAVANHFSAAVSADGRKFLMNPKWRHFSRIKASDLVLFDLDDAASVKSRPDVDPTAWAIHGQMHKQLPQARVVMHLHPPFATTIACLADPDVKKSLLAFGVDSKGNTPAEMDALLRADAQKWAQVIARAGIEKH